MGVSLTLEVVMEEIAAPLGEATIIIHYLRRVLDIHLRVGQDFVHQQHFHFLWIFC